MTETVKRSDLQTWKMVAGNEDRYPIVIDGKYRYDWTALGWRQSGLATEQDKAQYPKVVDE